MGIKLITMCYLCSILLLSCRMNKDGIQSEFTSNVDDYVKSYKIAFTCGCINEGTGEGLSKLIRESNDLGLFTEAEVLSGKRISQADSLGRLYSYRVKALDHEDLGGKKPYVSRCLYFAFSNEIDSLAKESHKLTLKQKD